MTWARKVDTTSKAVIDAFRAYGADWLDTSRSPGGIDGFVLFRGKVIPIEIKTRRGQAKLRLTKGQQTLQQRGWPIVVVCSPDEVPMILGAVIVSLRDGGGSCGTG